MPSTRKLSPRILSLTVHEFRTPVTVVAGYARMLLRGQMGPLSERQQPLVEHLERSCTRLAELVAELSDLAALQSSEVPLQRRELDLFSLVAEVAGNVQESADRGVRLEAPNPNVSGIVMGDLERLRATLRALLTAILREAPDNTTITAECSTRTLNGRGFATVALGDPKKLAALSESYPVGWGPFDEWRGGVGLTLPIALGIIESHGGRLASPRGRASREAILALLPLLEARA
jgi:two-component system, OmpR family, sensor histidine kinase KdpD